MKNRNRIFLSVGVVLLGVGFFAYGTDGPKLEGNGRPKPRGELLRAKMRTLWEDHIGFTRQYIVSALAGLKDKEAIAARLMDNQDEIASVFKPYYGLAFSKELSVLLRTHISIAAEVVSAAQADSNSALRKAQARWSANGAEITDHLIGANPHWDRAELEAMLKDHLQLTTQEIESRIAKDWKGDIKNYDELHGHMLLFSDFIVIGLERHFRDDPKLPPTSTQSLEASDRVP